MAIIGLVVGGPGAVLDASLIFGVAALFGGVVGSVLAPIATWSLMRHVPLWRAILETSVGTVAGILAGYWLAPHFGGALVSWIACGVVGFFGTALRLRLASRPLTAELKPPAG